MDIDTSKWAKLKQLKVAEEYLDENNLNCDPNEYYKHIKPGRDTIKVRVITPAYFFRNK